MTLAAVLFGAAWLAAGSTALATSDGAAPGGPGTSRTSMENVVVEPGQTLWSIARNADPGTDVRITVQRMMDVNGLHGPDVTPGEHLWVPRR